MSNNSFQVSISVIVQYFGKLPWYFDYFLHSCKYNPSVHFIIISDDFTRDREIPENIYIIHKTFDEIKILIKEKLQIEIALKSPYKLCDFKPAYGLIFSDLLSDYDFWGVSDIDLIFGNIREFITNEILKEYDVISVRPEYLSGFFSLYRNTKKINKLFEQSKDYKRVFKSSRYLGFDECSLLCDPLADGVLLSELSTATESMTHVVNKLEDIGKIKAYFNFHVVESTPGNLKWDNGKLIYKNEFEILLYHLVSFKIHSKLKTPTWKKMPTSFYINEFSFSKKHISKDEDI